MAQPSSSQYASIDPTLKKLAQSLNASDSSSAAEIANALALLLDGKLSETQAAALLSLLHHREKDKQIVVILECIRLLAAAQVKVDTAALNRVVSGRNLARGKYQGGLCDISGTGGNATAVISVAAMASVVASAKLLIAQHGYLSATYPVSSANPEDIISNIEPNAPLLAMVTANHIPRIYKHSNYLFLPERNFFPQMQHANRIRLGLGIRTIFDLTSTLLHPLHASCGLEARVVGVANPVLGPGSTSCWMLMDPPAEATSPGIQHFRLQPRDFGLSENPLASIQAKGSSEQEACVLSQLLHNQLSGDDPLLQCVLMHVAALFVTSGVCDTLQEDGVAETGPCGGRWKEGARLARSCIMSGEALKGFETFGYVTSRLE
ncbi:nucleoside phosphorylase/phosphoribosyltransferase catalytic domain-containing protein [Aspergillus novofumigatus IBT 16806]|uniref:Nucleoside phosphorylase/phosphoribosyltransferase catalytic domain-containing protein n=1 Tax=Aspergillus novofumigatus (strain IBT 16806) TaxID=1392255 RepID=A0A2I1BVR2_ASPN1|nr:nucleoside phosphorylase/phosphoribosyltransferase catalytic domain-containing protein [Aspergillus novofumigatus IBT 16806]PKX89391.1 nucleoside phosphorylase/phosphoribosyltransferase catalytic domain-containing protein [Aspergillus novofumigatus IBT 16806]